MRFELNEYQDNFVFSEARFPCLSAGIGTGKTLAGILRMVHHMEKYPNNLGIVLRKEFTDLRDSTMKDFETYTGIKIPVDKTVVFPNGSQILFRHAAEFNVLKNINAGAILIEQAEEFETDEVFVFLRDRLRRKNTGRSLFIISNAKGHNWIWKLWKINANKDPEFFLQEATTFDNEKNLPKDYVDDLRKMEKTHGSHYRRFVLNSWEDEDVQDNIFKMSEVERAVNLDIPKGRTKVISCDPARFGDDFTVIYAIDGGRVVAEDKFNMKSTMETVGRLLLFSVKQGIEDFVVDEIGLGAGIVDRLVELGKNVVSCNSAKKSTFPTKYKNLRAEVYGTLADHIERGVVSIPNDEVLKEQLLLIKYKTIESNGVVQVESKELIKKRIGKSPDEADCLAMGIWALDKVDPYKEDPYVNSQKQSYNWETR